MTDKEMLLKLMATARNLRTMDREADFLIANGVTFATDTNVGLKWIPVEDGLPDEYVSVLGHMVDTDGFPSVRECFLIGNEFWFPALLTTWPVDRWAELPEV